MASLLTAVGHNELQIEEGIATQSQKLFRLVAGLLMAVAFASATPFSPACRRWICGHVLSVLIRAESAAQSLMIAQAFVLAGRRGMHFRPAALFTSSGTLFPNGDRSEAELPSLSELTVRLKALRAVLFDVPRFAMRLLKRVVAQSVKTMRGGGLPRYPAAYEGVCAHRFVPEPNERPPDKVSGAFILQSPPDSPRRSSAARTTINRSLPPETGRGGVGG